MAVVGAVCRIRYFNLLSFIQSSKNFNLLILYLCDLASLRNFYFYPTQRRKVVKCYIIYLLFLIQAVNPGTKAKMRSTADLR